VQVALTVSQASLDAFVQTGYLSKDERDDPGAVAAVLQFFVEDNARDLLSAQSFWRHKLAKRDEREAQRAREREERQREERDLRRAAAI
jgi:hypothetical protein